MSGGRGSRAEETPRSVDPEGSSATIAGEFPLLDKAGLGVCRLRFNALPKICMFVKC